jgi:hypothetical protein
MFSCSWTHAWPITTDSAWTVSHQFHHDGKKMLKVVKRKLDTKIRQHSCLIRLWFALWSGALVNRSTEIIPVTNPQVLKLVYFITIQLLNNLSTGTYPVFIECTDRSVERKWHRACWQQSSSWLHHIQCGTIRKQERQGPAQKQWITVSDFIVNYPINFCYILYQNPCL